MVLRLDGAAARQSAAGCGEVLLYFFSIDEGGVSTAGLFGDPSQQRVAYLEAADNISEPLLIRLSRVNQPVISPPNVILTLLPSLLADI
jgi:hypothetical protein